MRALAAGLALVALITVLPAPADAQFAWDGPSLVSPHAPTGLSVLLVGSDPGGALGVMGQWRRAGGKLDWGYRGGLVQDDADDLSLFGGIDLSGTLAESIEDADIQVVWWTGAGAGLGDRFALSVPVGLALGWKGLGDGNVFAPYAGAHVALDIHSGSGDRVKLNGSLDLGLDLTLVSGWMVRFGASLFGRDALAVGLRIPN